LLDDPKVIEKRVKSAVTDSGSEVVADRESKPGVTNLMSILSALTGRGFDQIEHDFAGRRYGDLKKEVAAAVLEEIVPYGNRVRDYLDDPDELDRLLAAGATKAREVASGTLATVYENVGFLAGSRG